MAEERKVKQVIVFRKDLLKGDHSIRKGKMGAQVAHASLGAMLTLFNREIDENGGTHLSLDFEKDSFIDKWLNGIFTKICLGVSTEEDMLALYDKIKKEAPQIPCVKICDSGLTEFHGVPTNTCIGIGPFWSDEIDNFTSTLSLL